MIERVARAMCDADSGKVVYDDDARMEEGSGSHARDRNTWRAQARVAIAAMREPTMTMLEAVPPTHFTDAAGMRQELLHGGPSSFYRLMIDAALQG